MNIQRVGQLSIMLITRGKMYKSFIVCKDERGNNIIIASNNKDVDSLVRNHYISITKKEKIDMVKEMMKCQMRGKPLPTSMNRYDEKEYRYKIISKYNENIRMETFVI